MCDERNDRQVDVKTDGRTDGRQDGQTDGQLKNIMPFRLRPRGIQIPCYGHI